MSKTPTVHLQFRHAAIFGLLLLSIALVALLSICLGSVPLKPKVVFEVFFGGLETDSILQQIIVDFRVPRVLTALLAGAALSTAGLMMQALFRNPLADPFVLGVNSGASLGVALVVLAVAPMGIQLTGQLNISGQLLLILASSGGAALVLFIVLLFSYKTDAVSVLIIGLMISYVVGALVSILMFLSMAERLQSFLSWSFGNYGKVNWVYLQTFAPVTFSMLTSSLLLIKPLDALLLGEAYAESMGTNVKRDRFVILLIASVLAGTVTGFCGPVGFIGIAAPHLSRALFKTSSHRILIPASILIGGFLSISADCIAQGPGLNMPLPLNAITALFGAPIIIAALVRQRTMGQTFK